MYILKMAVRGCERKRRIRIEWKGGTLELVLKLWMIMREWRGEWNSGRFITVDPSYRSSSKRLQNGRLREYEINGAREAL